MNVKRQFRFTRLLNHNADIKSNSKNRSRDKLVFNDYEKDSLKIAAKHCRTGHRLDRSLLLMKLALIAANQNTDIVEIGVFKGGSAQLIISALSGISSPINLTLFDTFEGHPKSSVNRKVDGAQRVGHFKATNDYEVRDYLNKLGKSKNLSIFVHKADVMLFDLNNALGDRPIGLCHIDTDLYAPTLRVLLSLADKIAPGGFFLIDDYNEVRTPGLLAAVQEFMELRRDFTFVPCVVTQAILVKNNF